jgi:hypothetical protein
MGNNMRLAHSPSNVGTGEGKAFRRLISADGGLTAFADWAEDRHSCSVLCLWVSFGLGGGLLRKMLRIPSESSAKRRVPPPARGARFQFPHLI